MQLRLCKIYSSPKIWLSAVSNLCSTIWCLQSSCTNGLLQVAICILSLVSTLQCRLFRQQQQPVRWGAGGLGSRDSSSSLQCQQQEVAIAAAVQGSVSSSSSASNARSSSSSGEAMQHRQPGESSPWPQVHKPLLLQTFCQCWQLYNVHLKGVQNHGKESSKPPYYIPMYKNSQVHKPLLMQTFCQCWQVYIL